jgi:hypothetical protein
LELKQNAMIPAPRFGLWDACNKKAENKIVNNEYDNLF